MIKEDEFFMKEALSEARKALEEGEIPVGAVITKDGQIIGRGRNSSQREGNPLCHAEIIAINEASKTCGRFLNDCTLYVTLEPCPMCAGAILGSRIKRVVIGARDEKGGAMGSLIDLSKLQCIKGPSLKISVMEEKCSEILEEFFRKIRLREP